MADGKSTRKTGKAKVRTDSSGNKVYGPYKGSDQNKGRPIVVKRSANGKTTSTNAARHEKEQSTGRKLAKSDHVAHKKGTTRSDTAPSKTRVEKGSKNIADGNRDRTSKGRKKSR